MAKDEDRTLVRLQAAKRAIHDVAIDHASELIARDVIGEIR